MTVQELRETLTQLVALLQAADAKAATTKALNDFVESTAGFNDLSLKEFVKLAEAGRTQATAKAPSPRAGGSKKGVDAGALSVEVKGLYERAGDASVTEEQIRTVCGQLVPLSKDLLAKLAEEIGLYGMKSKKKDEIISQITARLLDRKGAAIRRQLIDRPVASEEP